MNTATETQKKVAAAYLEYIARSENDLEWSEVSGCMAVNENTYEDSTEDPNFSRIGTIANDAHARPGSLQWTEMCACLMEGLVAWSKDTAAYEVANGGTAQAIVEMWAGQCRKILTETAA